MQPSFNLRVTHSLTLTPRLQQSIKLLQLSSLELEHALRHALASNPFLEEDEAQSGTHQEETQDAPDHAINPIESIAATATASVSDDAIDNSVDAVTQADSQAEFSEHDHFDDDDLPLNSLEAYPQSRGDGDSDYLQVGESQVIQFSLHQHLHHVLHHYHLNQRDRLLAELVIEALDDDGYLREDLHSLADSLEIDPAPDDTELSTSLKLIQQLDLPGIGARDLAECLHLQLQALSTHAGDDQPHEVTARHTRQLALRIIDEHLNRLAKREYIEVEHALQCSSAELRSAFQLIRDLDPKPGLRYGASRTVYVTPDVIVRKIKGLWRVETNPAVLPRTRLNQSYATMFRNAQCKDRAPLSQELQEARWLIRNVEQRFSTIQRVAEAIVAHQRTFFEYGETALKPYRLRECAESLDLHESTISRATGNKYMATPRGIFEFRHFFSRELATESGGACSASAVRALLKEMIGTENGDNPLSDVELARRLASRGIVVARRTVTKYRGQLKYPPADQRQKI